MYDLAFFRNNLDAIAKRLADRGFALDVDAFRKLDAERRAAVTESEKLKAQRQLAGMFAIGLLVLLIVGIGHAALGPAAPQTAANGTGNLSGIATLIFTTYVFPFEATGALLITAALGAMVLAHRERTVPRPTQRELAARRLVSGHLAPDPSPGVYALHDSADRPALLPDGTTSDLSVSTVLSPRDVIESPQFVPADERVAITAERMERELAEAGETDS